ncbi:unnamed protein product [Jaminaea pallidilutea]
MFAAANYLPAFLSGWDLPSLASYTGLSTSLQKRIVSFILKRYLGKYVQPGQLDWNQIDAGITQGTLDIKDVHLSIAAINELLTAGPVRACSVVVGNISIRLPMSDLRAGGIVVTVSGIAVELEFAQQGSNAETLFNSQASASTDTLDQSEHGLADATESMLQETREGRELESSILDSAATDVRAAAPAGPGQPPSQAGGIVAGIVENLLARISVQVRDTLVKVHLSPTSSLGNRGLLEASVDELDFFREVQDSADAVRRKKRTIEVHGVKAYLTPPLQQRRATTQSSSSNSSSSSSTSSSMDSNDEMKMSQAVPDLYASAVSIASSHYTDATSGSQMGFRGSNVGQDEARSVGDIGRHQILDTGRNTVGITIATNKKVPENSEAVFGVNEPQNGVTPEAILQTSTSFADLRVTAGCWTWLLMPADICYLLSTYNEINSSSQPMSARPALDAQSQSAAVETKLQLQLQMQALNLSVATDDNLINKEAVLASFWSSAGDRRAPLNRLQLTAKGLSAESGPAPGQAETSFSASVQDLRLNEYLLGGASPSPAVFPVIAFDQGQSPSPWSLDDWRQKVNSPRRGSSQRRRAADLRDESVSADHHNCVSFSSSELRDRLFWRLDLAPLDVYSDLSLVNRLMPLLHSLGKTHSTRSPVPSDAADSLAASIETLLADKLVLPHARDTVAGSWDIYCPRVRLHLRVPSSGSSDAQASEFRSGILGVSLKDVQATQGPGSAVEFGTATPQGPSVRYVDTTPVEGRPDWQVSLAAIEVAFQPVGQTERSDVLLVSQLSESAGDAGSELRQDQALRPRIWLTDTNHKPGSRPTLHCHLPCVSGNLSKDVFNGLQVAADDAAKWASGIARFGESSLDEQDGLRILGSQFFGSNSGLSAVPGGHSEPALSMKEQEGDKGKASPCIKAEVTELSLTLNVPAIGEKDASAASQRTLKLSGRDLHVDFDPSHAKDSTAVNITMIGLTAKEGAHDLIQPTLQPSLTRAIVPVVAVALTLHNNPQSGYRESRVEPTLRDVTVSLQDDPQLFTDLSNFFSAPAGVFENVEPNELTRLNVRAENVSLQYAPRSTMARAVVLLSDLNASAKFLSVSPQSTYHLNLGSSTLFLGEAERVPGDTKRVRVRSAADHWTSRSLAKVVRIEAVDASLTSSRLTLPDLDVRINRARSEILACADTFTILDSLVDSWSAAEKKTTGEIARDTVEDSSESSTHSLSSLSKNLLDSLEENAFRASSSTASIPDMVEDDIPSRPEFFGQSGQTEEARSIEEVPLSEDEFFGGGLAASVSETPMAETQSTILASDDQVVFSTEHVTVRRLDPPGMRPTYHHFNRTDLHPSRASPFKGLASIVRLRIRNCDIALKLHNGFDWATTRTDVEQEIKAVRRRLQKIKQLLDQGQKPDDSVEEATQDLMQSMHISLEPDADVSDAVNVLNDELGLQSETASSTTTWQPMPRSQGAGAFAGAQRPTRSKLERSYQPAIEFNFQGLSLNYDIMASGSPLSSSLAASLRTVQILDHLKTSTWKTFLTEMAPSARQYRPRSTAMMRLQLLSMRSGSESEKRVRARIAPLRLHVDQDALDFLKKFFAFKKPGDNTAPGSEDSGAPDGAGSTFIQYAEILPINLKLDYKPKRIDYNLLRQGKTIELMNFFHFEDAEMTLRHVKLRGITGWARLFDTLNDIWTPDVKANQLADVLSGISPFRSVVNVGTGAADLILLPIEQWQKDGRLGKGLQRGARRFAKVTALEAVKMGARFATGTQVILEKAERVLGGDVETALRARQTAGSDTRSSTNRPQAMRRSSSEDADQDSSDGEEGVMSTIIDPQEETNLISKSANRPESMQQALNEAYAGMSSGFSSAAQTILAVPMEVYERQQGGSGGRTVVKAVPIAVMQGARGATEAVSKTLMGLRGALEGSEGRNRERTEDKYKKDPR